jgi:hypothetical protein
MNILQVNKISQLHDGENIIFCKTDWILEDFKRINTLNNDVIFITGNSDYCITDDLASKAPKNIKKWYCANRLSDNPILESIPAGVENTIACKREGHGYVWDHAHEKTKVLSNVQTNTKTTEFLYSNFNVNTNPSHRIPIRDISKQQEYITWHDANCSYSDFAKQILDHEGVICAQGNDRGDNHRIYETLYLGRIPLTFNILQYKYLHNIYPIVLLKDINELLDKETLKKRIAEVKHGPTTYLDCDYWLNKINEKAKEYNIVG